MEPLQREYSTKQFLSALEGRDTSTVARALIVAAFSLSTAIVLAAWLMQPDEPRFTMESYDGFTALLDRKTGHLEACTWDRTELVCHSRQDGDAYPAETTGDSSSLPEGFVAEEPAQ